MRASSLGAHAQAEHVSGTHLYAYLQVDSSGIASFSDDLESGERLLTLDDIPKLTEERAAVDEIYQVIWYCCC